MLKENLLNNEKGQSFFEFIIFLPFILLLYQVTINISASINGSINQQKITRGYFFARVKGNSTIPTPNQISGADSIIRTGLVAFGWKETGAGSEEDSEPAAPCYKMSSVIQGPDDEVCDPGGGGSQEGRWIRVKTAFGVCGTNYEISDDGVIPTDRDSYTGSCITAGN